MAGHCLLSAIFACRLLTHGNCTVDRIPPISCSHSMAQSAGVPRAQHRGVEQTRPLKNPVLAAAVSGPRTQGAMCCSLMRQASVSVCVCKSARSRVCACLRLSINQSVSQSFSLVCLLHDRVWLIWLI